MTVPVYQGPKISEDVPASTRFHLQQIYQKLGNHAQGFALMQQTIAELKAQVAALQAQITKLGG